ncbi:MAG: alpha-L-fucosidase [Fimbriimonadales bacterium]
MDLRLLALPLLAASSFLAQAQSLDPNAGETKEHRDARMKWWREARFGMFIHWGLYAQLAGEYQGKRTNSIGEWIMHDLKIPLAEYQPLTKQFNPVQFNADQWVSIAKAAGMKYIVMTSKHHEGFAMFHSQSDPFNIWDATPFKRDPIAEMGAACKRQGLKFGVYYSQAQDWNHPGGAAYGGHWDKAQDGDLHGYVKKVAAPQVAELLTKYKPAILWWDTSVEMSPEDIKSLTAHFKDDPGLIANNRLGNGIPGDTETPEQFIPATGYPGRDWETCMTINDTWGYKSFDTNFKSTSMLLRNLIDIASKGGNYLLNVGPEPTGLIPAPEVERLQQMGQWLKKNGASVYATTASPYKRLPFEGRCTVKGHTLYLNVFTWPADGLKLTGLQTPVRDASCVGTGEKLNVEKLTDGSVSIARPSAVDPISTAIALNLDGAPVVVEPEYAIPAEANGIFRLNAVDAKLSGSTIQAENGRRGNIGYWTNASDTVEWKIKVATAGSFGVSLDCSCEPGTEGSTFEIVVDGAASGITGTVPKTASWTDYRPLALDGTLSLSAGSHTIRVVPRTKPGLAVMNLRRLTLTPK